jgi:glucose-1-phosphate thymidylyltransferase
MKAIIPLAGTGFKSKYKTVHQLKSLIPLAHQESICYIIDQLEIQNVREIIIIVGFYGERVIEFLTQKYPEIVFHFVFQKFREGLAHAIYLCREYIEEEEPLIIQLGDSLLELDYSKIDTNQNYIGVKTVNNPSNFGIVKIENGIIVDFEEKPKHPTSNLAMAGFYYLSKTTLFFEVLTQLIKGDIKTDNEPLMISEWFNLGDFEKLMRTNEYFLKNRSHENNSPQADIVNSIIIPPVYIHSNAKVMNSIIGPYVTIGQNCVIENSQIKHGIVCQNAQLNGVMLSKHLIGANSIVKGNPISMNLEENAELYL